MHEKPAVVKTHLRNMIIMPEMIGSVVGVYNGKTYIGVEIKAEMVSFEEEEEEQLAALAPLKLLACSQPRPSCCSLLQLGCCAVVRRSCVYACMSRVHPF